MTEISLIREVINMRFPFQPIVDKFKEDEKIKNRFTTRQHDILPMSREYVAIQSYPQIARLISSFAIKNLLHMKRFYHFCFIIILCATLSVTKIGRTRVYGRSKIFLVPNFHSISHYSNIHIPTIFRFELCIRSPSRKMSLRK